MSNETSADTGKRYGLKRVCQTLNFPRSSIHAERARAKATVTPITSRAKKGDGWQGEDYAIEELDAVAKPADSVIEINPDDHTP